MRIDQLPEGARFVRNGVEGTVRLVSIGSVSVRYQDEVLLWSPATEVECAESRKRLAELWREQKVASG